MAKHEQPRKPLPFDWLRLARSLIRCGSCVILTGTTGLFRSPTQRSCPEWQRLFEQCPFKLSEKSNRRNNYQMIMPKQGFDLTSIDVIAELANAHEGDQSKAVEMIEAISSSADAAKVQVFTADDLAVSSYDDYELYQNLALSTSDLSTIANVAHNRDIHLFADILGDDGLEQTANIDIDGYKIHSSDLTNKRLIRKIAKQNKPTIISAGGATSVEIEDSLSSFKSNSEAPIGIVYGFQNYPTKIQDANLNRLRKLIGKFGDALPVGYSSHIDGGSEIAKRLPAWAVAAGADFVEIHVTLDRSKEGIDYYSSLEPDQFETMKHNVETVQTALGEPSKGLSMNEQEYRNSHKKRVVATRQIDAGHTISESDVGLKRVHVDNQSVFVNIDKVVGREANNLIKNESAIQTTDVKHKVAAVLACRAESTRLYGKPLQLVGDKPILSHVITQLLEINRIDDVVLAIADTPSKKSFENIANKYGLEYVIGDEVDVLGRVIKASDMINADIVVRAMTENPFLYNNIIGDQIDIAIKENADLSVPRALPVGAFVEVASTYALKQSHKLGKDRHRSELVTSFITENPDSFKIVGIDPPQSVRRPDIRLTVDNPSDLILVRELWNFLSNKDDSYNIKKLIEYYDEKSFKSINNDKPDGKSDEVIDQSWHIYGNSTERIDKIYKPY